MLAVRQAALKSIHDQVTEFRAPFPTGLQSRAPDRLGLLAGEDGPRKFCRRVGLEGSHVVQVHFLVGVGTALVSTRSADGIDEEGDGTLGIAALGGFPCRRLPASPFLQ